MTNDQLYLIHMRECLAKIERYLEGGRDSFLGSELIQDAVARNLQTAAGSSQRLSEAFRTQHAEVDWKGISGFRNVLVHDYLGIDLGEVWKIIEHEIPSLRRFLDSAIE